MNSGVEPVRGSAVVVGASLAGLMAALALARIGMEVDVLERSDDTGRTGAALQAEPGLLEQLTGRGAASLRAAIPTGVQTWFAVHAALRAAADAECRIRLHQQTNVREARQDTGRAWVVTGDDKIFEGDIVIGADGHRSVVRRSVCPDKPDAEFAGYLIWIGIVDELAIAPQRHWPRDLAILNGGGHTFLGCSLPDDAGTREPGQGRLGWGWYDAGRNDLLRAQGCVVGNVVHHTLRAADIPEATYRELAREARKYWPSPWRDAVLDCIERRAVIGTPIAEYLPERLVDRRLALVGDAAHVPTPMTGNGFSASFRDALALAECVDECRGAGFEAALQRYQAMRLEDVRRLVQGGQNFSRGFARGG
ncbi:2-polyprenyl-6-methoxyphenol hydroxylase-like FAD-dependent oxidoreductase [Pseudoduganella lurida]|uniref:2-polyprenyl-6-methoxyphenol hydroxylase-like FAD-dependent oxidoreductase n=1 Tax=Pseudoduganella lurida TaxID=1036180 RepID=A0A562R228_9BURK|nr:FAD-dependent monooxygenase [Pseudoduganella lurida]TWI62520.1 2-polyprenyl-6-methoxyphenol hydroxylase-like FAD-dependent oxidoreductase [Pseudoduganella lurida]